MNIYIDFSLRLFVAGLMGVLIGLEREYRAKEAGLSQPFPGGSRECTDDDCFAVWIYGCTGKRPGPVRP